MINEIKSGFKHEIPLTEFLPEMKMPFNYHYFDAFDANSIDDDDLVEWRELDTDFARSEVILASQFYKQISKLH
ncbi:hypothetical protein [Chitinophaga polysaccharea]|uniref:hypothetical protein n=1 Tax=Chitinophaga polysaccharea TaxID=1293035 RepID=UPI0011588B7B|nr:hypothetical protein [Chitinophaga polysaccharea]